MNDPSSAEQWKIKDVNRPYAIKAIGTDLVAMLPYKPGDICYVNKYTYDYYTKYSSPNWEMIGLSTCRKPLAEAIATEVKDSWIDELDSWFSGIIALEDGAEPGSYLLQCKSKTDSYWHYGDRMWWDHDADSFEAGSGDDGIWITVRKWDHKLDSGYYQSVLK